ncbi:MAG TPA: DUF6311 domain-containing protein [Bryobacteraceae bacterium]
MPRQANSQSRWRFLLPALMGTLVFLSISGARTLNPGHIGWLTAGDPAQHFLGWQFFRNTPILQSPLGANPDFGMELGSSIVYTDSLPLLAFLFKPFRALLPQTFQYMGMWMLVCFILQAILAWKLIERFSPDRWIQLFGAGFFTLAPPFLLRMHGHESLMGHWLILAALLLYFSDRWSPGPWLALLLVASLVHAYLMLMVAAIWAADRATRLLSRQITIPQAAVSMAGSLAILALVMWQAGYFMLPSVSLQGGGYGFYRMNMVSPFHANGGWSVFMADNFLGPGDDEGFNFLGIGGIILLILAVGESLRDGSVWKGFRRIWPIAAVAAMLTVYALSNHVAFGNTELFTIALHPRLEKLTSVFRASGRVFWPVFYLIYLGAMYVLATRYRPRVAAGILGCLLLLQVADSSLALGILHKKLTGWHPWVSSLQSPFWPAAAHQYRRIIYVPPHNVPRNYFDLCYFAATNHMATNIGAFARVDLEQQAKTANEIFRSVSAGEFAADAIYVFEQGKFWTTALAALRPGDRAGALDGFRVLAPGWSGCPSCAATGAFGSPGNIERLLTYRLGTPISFDQQGNSADYILDGFSIPEPWGLWTEGKLARLGFRLAEDPGPDVTFAISSYAYIGLKHPIQEAQVVVNGQAIGKFSFMQSGAAETRVMRIPREALMAGGGEVIMELHLPNAISPTEVGEPADGRHLGLGLVWATFNKAKD